MILFRFRSSVLHVALVVRESASLVAIVVAGNRQDGKLNALVFFWSRHHRVVVGVRNWMLQPLLKDGGRISRDAIEFLKRQMPIVVFARLGSPKSSGTEKVRVASDSARKREPLLDVGRENIVLERKIHTGMRRSSGDNRCEMRRKLFEDRPLIKSRIRPAPHRHFPVAIRLLREPLDDVI